MTENLTKSQIVAADVAALLRARNPLIWIVTREEARVEGYLASAAAAASYLTVTWDVAAGVQDLAGNPKRMGSAGNDPDSCLDAVMEFSKKSPDLLNRYVWIMRDLAPWLQGPSSMSTVRRVRNLARTLPATELNSAQAVIVLSPSSQVPEELAAHATVIEWPLPDREEMGEILDVVLETVEGASLVNGERDAAIDAAVGLSGEEAQACYSKSLVQLRKIDPTVVAQEKKRVITRERVLEWYDPIPGGLDAVGGLDLLKTWLIERRLAYSAKARAYGLPAPRGALLVGVPGCGKSLTAKAVATAWGVPLLRLDLGALRSKFVGESETNLRKVFKVAEAIGRCVIWLDEIEKSLQGATSGSADGGVSADALGAILSWMQERAGEAFVIATANDAKSLPPELLRKGRFDEVWFVDLPNTRERVGVLSAALKSHGRGKLKIDLDLVAASCETFTGSEVAELVPTEMFSAFSDKGREITTADLIEATKTVTPLAKTAAEKIEELRTWAATRARPATSPVAQTGAKINRGRVLDIRK